MKKGRFVLFISFFVLLFLALNYFSLSNIFESFRWNQGPLFYTILFLLSFSYPITVVFERLWPMMTTKLFYRIASIWIGIAFFSLITFVIYRAIKLFFKFNDQIGSAVVLSVIVIMSVVSIINGKRLNIKPIDVPIRGLKKEMSLVHLSDLHIGAIHQKEFLERVVKETNSLNPDAVVITGDIVDGSTKISTDLFSPINKIKAPVYFCVGNHEIYEGLDRVLPILNKTKMKILRGQQSKLGELNIIGIDYNDSRRKILIKLNKMGLSKKYKNILLYHAPIFRLKKLEKHGIDLHLAGHTHNGQIFPMNLFVGLFYPYPSGYYKSKNSAVITSPGTGTWGPPMRLGSTNQINLINLKKHKEEEVVNKNLFKLLK